MLRGELLQRKMTHIIFMFVCSIVTGAALARHPFRQPAPNSTNVTVYRNGHKPCTLFSNRLRVYPLFAFHTKDLHKDLIPSGPIPYRRDPSQSITGKKLSDLVEHIVFELMSKGQKVKTARSTRDGIIIRDKNFDYKTLHGLIIFKCKQYPFVIKLFMEKPDSFFDFKSTGVEPTFFFYMGGGANRHLTGMTRIKNRNIVQEAIKQIPRWKNHIEIIRKWFWLPKQAQDLHLVGKNIGGHKEIRTCIPSIYAVIEDLIDLKHETITLVKKKKQRMILELCNDLHIYIDPHPNNYAFIKDPNKKQFKIALLDTEHFPTMAGMQKRVRFKCHKNWYTFLAQNYLKNLYFQTKQDLISLQNSTSKVSLDKPIL